MKPFPCLLLLSLPLSAEFIDPAPPKVLDPGKIAKLEAKPFNRLTFHKAPKPLPAGAVTEDWHRFLGASDTAISKETKLLKKFPPAGPAKVWEIEKGNGYTCPTVANGRMFLFHRLDDHETIECIHPETGQRHWTYHYPIVYSDRYGYNNGPRASVVIDGERIYTLGVTSMVHCLRAADGAVFWKRDLASEFRVRGTFFGQGGTPLIHGGRIYINLGGETGPCVIALDKLTGKMLWGAGDKWGASYASPVVATFHGKEKLLVFAGGESRPATGGLLCLDPATGKLDFEFPWRADKYESVNAATPVVLPGNRIYITECYKIGGVMLEVTPEFFPDVVWKAPKFGVHFMTPVLDNGYLYGFDGRHDLQAELVCYEAKDGKEMWRDRSEWGTPMADGRDFRIGFRRGNLLKVDGSWLVLGEYGSLAWMDLNPTGATVLSRHQLFIARETWTLPAIHNGLLYVAQNTKDYLTDAPSRFVCYDLRGD
jgi:outer membrane protein assembly factor BamB